MILSSILYDFFIKIEIYIYKYIRKYYIYYNNNDNFSYCGIAR